MHDDGMTPEAGKKLIRELQTVFARQLLAYYLGGCAAPENLTVAEVEALKSKGKIAAIKALRDRTNCGLKEAKEQVEDYMLTQGLGFRNGNGYVEWYASQDPSIPAPGR